MSMKKIAAVLLVSAFSIGMIGCGGSSNSKNQASGDSSYDSSSGIKNVSSFDGEAISPEEELALLNKKVVYFDYDSSNLSPSDERLLSVHAKYLLEQPKLALRIEGNTDSRGSREYNILLGERRAKSVAQDLEVQGVPSSKLAVVSYGKEKPVNPANTEEAWAENRRAELVYEDRG